MNYFCIRENLLLCMCTLLLRWRPDGTTATSELTMEPELEEYRRPCCIQRYHVYKDIWVAVIMIVGFDLANLHT